jgi:hypothetical protein
VLVALAPARRHRELVGDRQQQQAADQQETRDLQQPDDDQRHQGPHRDRPDRAEHDRLAAQVGPQAARGDADDQRIVAGQHEVDQDDGAERPPPRSAEEFHGFPGEAVSLVSHSARCAAVIPGAHRGRPY